MSQFSINRVVLVGRLTRDPDLRALPSGASVCAMRIACNSSHRDREGGEYVDRPNYFDINAYGPPAERVAEFMRKGNRVAVDGRLEWREWETDQQKRQAVSIVADTVMFLDPPGDRPGGSEGEELVGAGAGGEGEGGELVF